MRAKLEARFLVLLDLGSGVESDAYSRLEWTRVLVQVEGEQVVMAQVSEKAEKGVSELVYSAT